nr:hypothetical protein [Tanacetum cinerariifolium]
ASPPDSELVSSEVMEIVIPEDFSESNEEFSSIDDDSFSIDNIDYVEASPPDFELVSSEVMEIVILESTIVSSSRLNQTRGDFTKDVVEIISSTKEPQVLNTLPTHPTLQLNMKFQPSSERIPKKDKIRSKPDKNGKRGKAEKSQKQSQSVEQEKLKKMQKEGPEMQTHTSYIRRKKKTGASFAITLKFQVKGLNLQFIERSKRGARFVKV